MADAIAPQRTSRARGRLLALLLFGGKAINSWGGDDNVPKAAMTDDNGRFELPAGDAKKLAVSGSAIDAWPADIAAEGDTIIKLPEPAKVEIQLDIEGADKESNVFLQLLVSHMPGFEGVRLETTQPIANGGKLTQAERRQVNHQENRTSNAIYNKKHNARVQ